MDCIQITGIRAYGYIGALPEEQVLGQWFEVDLKLWLNLAIAGQSDRLEDTFNYCAAVEAVQQLVTTNRFKLLEKLAQAIADTLLATGDLQQVEVRVTKLAAPIPNFDGKITVEITRPLP